VAVNSPIPGVTTNSGTNLHVFLEALGRYRYDADPTQGPPVSWELVPGVHWRVGESWWLSTGVMLPLNAPKPDTGLWQLTCSWQF
jgi:hypothetical protein